MGRIPTSNSARITYALDKLVAFEQDTASWKNGALHAGAFWYFEDEDGDTTVDEYDGAVCLDLIEKDILNSWTISHYSEQEGEAHSAYPWPPVSHTAFTTDWRTGRYSIVNWGAHGWVNYAARKVWAWDDGDDIPESHEITWPDLGGTFSYLDDDHPCIFFPMSCLIGYPEPYSSNMGIDLLTRPSWGASIGVVSGTRLVWGMRDWPNNQGGVESMCYEFYRHLIDGPSGPEKVGEALYNSQFYCHINYPMGHYGEYWDLFTYNLYGDPSLVREGLTVGVEAENPVETPAFFALLQNHPNPFNPITEIQYDLPRACHVKLEIYNLLGQRVTTLVDERETAGHKSVRWDSRKGGGEFSDGIYFCRLQAGDFGETRKMVLLK